MWNKIHTLDISKIASLENTIKKYRNKHHRMFRATMNWLHNYVPAFKNSDKCSMCEFPSALKASVLVTERNYIAEDMINTMIDLEKGFKIDKLIEFIEDSIDNKQTEESKDGYYLYSSKSLGPQSIGSAGSASAKYKVKLKKTKTGKYKVSTSKSQPLDLDPFVIDFFSDYGDLPDKIDPF